MKIAKKYRPELVASKDKTREVLQEPYLLGGWLAATNGRSLVAVRVERDAHDVDGFVPVEALKAARKVRTRETFPDAEIRLNGAAEVAEGPTFPRSDAGTFPNWGCLVPGKKRRPREVTIKLDAHLLYDLARALGSDGPVTIRVVVGPDMGADERGEHMPVMRVDAGDPARAFGLLVPMKQKVGGGKP